jgi:hypothetical protein
MTKKQLRDFRIIAEEISQAILRGVKLMALQSQVAI